MHIAVLLISAVLCSPQTPDTLDAVKVTSERNAAALAAAPVRKMGADGIGRIGAQGLHEVLRTFAGVSIKDYGGIGGLKTVSVRSLGAQHTAVRYDGMSVSDACNGQIDISRFNLENVGEVEMEIGMSDDIFRSARELGSAGTLSIRSAVPTFEKGRTSASARMRFASFGTYNPYFIVRRKIGEGWAATASLDWLGSEGSYPFTVQNGKESTVLRRLGSDVHAFGAEANLYGELSRGGSLRGKFDFYSSERGLPGAMILYTQDPTERLRDRDIRGNLSYEKAFGDGWKARCGAAYSNLWNRYVNSSAFYATPEEDIYAQQEWAVGGIVMKGFGEHFRVSLAEDIFVNHLDSNIPECPFPTRLSSLTALSGQYRSERLTVTAILGATLMGESVRTGSAAPARRRLSPALSASWLVADGLRLRASVKDGFRVPTFNDLYYARVGNTSLQPEKALQLNLGTTWTHPFRGGSVTLTADGWWNRVKDKIVAIPTMFIWKMRNVGLVQMLGSDVTAALVMHPGRCTVHLDASWSWQHAVDVSDPKAKNYGHQIQYTPHHSGGIVAGIDTPWVGFGYTLTAVGERWYQPQNLDMYRLEPYADHSISVHREFRIRGVTLLASAEALNLADVNYEIVHSYPMPGRSYRLSVKLTY